MVGDAYKSFRHADLTVFPLCLGGNVFGWTADRATSFAILDMYVAAGGNFIDTADIYSVWADGHTGGESETVLGEWMRARRNRESLVIATKVGADGGLAAENIRTKLDASLKRLQTDRVDLYYAHRDDSGTQLSETLTAFDQLKRAGKVRYIAASNYSGPRLAEALALSTREGLARYVALQPQYNMVERSGYEDGAREIVDREGLDCLPYSSLASGFLTGKYRHGVTDGVDTRRGPEQAAPYFNERGARVVGVIDQIATERGVRNSTVALAWLARQPTVLAPLAGARTSSQLGDLLAFTSLDLDRDEIARLTTASS